MTRIVAGLAGGRRLAVPTSGTRPTSDRVREALFSVLDSTWRDLDIEWSEVTVLDLYAGSGALGLEALSRGARDVVLVERARAAARTLAANVDAVGLPGAIVLTRDVDQLSGTAPPAGAAGLVLADPPYDVPAARVAQQLADLAETGWISAHAVLVVERPSRDQQSPLPPTWTLNRRRAYGDTALWYGRSESSGTADRGEGAD